MLTQGLLYLAFSYFNYDLLALHSSAKAYRAKVPTPEIQSHG
jgi:hypothetical protein